jgi:thioredoxin reductase
VIDADRLRGAQQGDGRIVPRSAVFIRTCNVPHADGLLTELGCALDEEELPKVDASGKTTTPGVRAAGDVVDPRSQVITAAGAGSVAAIAINTDLVHEDVELHAVTRRS